jgi:hypothetical protein
MLNKNKFLKYFILLIGLIIILFTIFYKPTKFTLTDEYIRNNTVTVNISKNKEYIENITYVGLHILDIDSATVNIFDMPNIIKRNNFLNGYTIKAFIINNFKNDYTIFIDFNEPLNNLLIILSHEFIHLEQYHSGRLELLFGGSIIKYNDNLYILKNIKYNNRPWEIDAFDKEFNLSTDIKSILYLP